MVAPSETFTVIPDTQVDADSPITEDLMTALAHNDIHLEEWVGKDYTAAQNHDHDGVNSSIIGTSIGQSELKTSVSNVSTFSTTPGSNVTLPGGEFGFYPKLANGLAGATTTAHIGEVVGTTLITNIRLFTDAGGGGREAIARQRYVTASGEIFWHFILRDKITKKLIARYAAPDHPCFGNGGDPEKVAHPFPDYDETKHEIIVIQAVSEAEAGELPCYPAWLEEALSLAKAPGKNLLQILKEDYEIDETGRPVWSDKPVTVGFKESPEDIQDIYHRGGKATLDKRAIMKPASLIHRQLKKKVTA